MLFFFFASLFHIFPPFIRGGSFNSFSKFRFCATSTKRKKEREKQKNRKRETNIQQILLRHNHESFLCEKMKRYFPPPSFRVGHSHTNHLFSIHKSFSGKILLGERYPLPLPLPPPLLFLFFPSLRVSGFLGFLS